MDLMIEDKTGVITQEHITFVSELIEYASSNHHIDLPEDTEMSITFVSNEEIHQINKEHRDKDRPTDVISFAMEEDDLEGFSVTLSDLGMPRNIGDLFISVDKISEQAKEYEHSFERELGFLVIHGFLHLNGYDHMTVEDEKEMFSLQRKILDAYGLSR